MTLWTAALVTAMALATGTRVCAKRPLAPNIFTTARVKPNHHENKAGQKLSRIVISFTPVKGALAYEVCQNCEISENKNSRVGKEGTLVLVPADSICGDDNCYDSTMLPEKWHSFHARARLHHSVTAHGYTKWSAKRVFNATKQIGDSRTDPDVFDVFDVFDLSMVNAKLEGETPGSSAEETDTTAAQIAAEAAEKIKREIVALYTLSVEGNAAKISNAESLLTKYKEQLLVGGAQSLRRPRLTPLVDVW